jgi:uridylate kinase
MGYNLKDGSEGQTMDKPKFKRILVKISGEALAGSSGGIVDFGVMGQVSDAINRCVVSGIQVGIVVGGGNIWRGAKDGGGHMNRTRADHMGMLATIINSLALADALEQRGMEVRVQTAMEIRAIAEPYIQLKAVNHLEKGRVVVFGGGMGNPFFSTDTVAVLRGAEIGAEAILLAKNVDGVYDSDPNKNPDARKYDTLTYTEILERRLAAMDSTATSLSMENQIPVVLFALKDPMNIFRVAMGEPVGTLVVDG